LGIDGRDDDAGDEPEDFIEEDKSPESVGDWCHTKSGKRVFIQLSVEGHQW
jgi:hypothetical protein